MSHARQTRRFNRELSWIEFNARVLEEGASRENPLLERLAFLCIVSSNFDEFFMVRVAALRTLVRNGRDQADGLGLTVDQVLEGIAHRVRQITARQYECLMDEILPTLANQGLRVLRPGQYDADTTRWLEAYFMTQVAPVLTPLAIDAAGDGRFPSTGNLRIHAGFLLSPLASTTGSTGLPENIAGGCDAVKVACPEAEANATMPDGAPPAAVSSDRLAIVQVPPNLGRFVRLPLTEDGTIRVALLDDLVVTYGHELFPGYAVSERALFKITRDADIGVDEDRDDDFVAAMEEILVNRQNSWPVRISISMNSPTIESLLMSALLLHDQDVYRLPGPIDLKSFMELALYKGFDHLRFARHEPVEVLALSDENTIWDEMRKRDIIIHLPYESFRPVEQFVESAALDALTLAIKITLYRTSGDSPIIKALEKAVRMGKQVTAIVELKARFDEERNMAWASRLEQAGVIVVYGVARLKVHAKMCLVVRREEDGVVRRYVHLSTGNYNDRTARLYSDISYFTTNTAICGDVGACFNMLTGVTAVMRLAVLSMAPFELKRRILAMIDRELERSTAEAPGFIAAKLNGLTDPDIIDALYRASNAGVRIILNIRGVCLLVPGIKKQSGNIKVVSVVGRYLEHSRIMYFRNGGAEELYLSSADWMPRNLERRIEVMFPVCGVEARERVYDILMSFFIDNKQARVLQSSGVWKHIHPADGETPFSAQQYFMEEAGKRKASIADHDQVLPVRRRRP
jgi:polyphosphate kinase